MKKKEIQLALNALKQIKMPKIEDKAIRNAIISNHLKLLGLSRKFNADFEDMRTVFLAQYEEEQTVVQKLQAELLQTSDKARREELVKTIESHKDYLEAVKDFNDKAAKLGEEEVEIEVIDGSKFVEEYQKQDYDLAVVEALYPMLNF